MINPACPPPTWSYARIGEVLLQREPPVEGDALLEVLQLRVHLRQLHGAGPVLLPLVPPEPVLGAVGVDVGPVGLRGERLEVWPKSLF